MNSTECRFDFYYTKNTDFFYIIGEIFNQLLTQLSVNTGNFNQMKNYFLIYWIFPIRMK